MTAAAMVVGEMPPVTVVSINGKTEGTMTEDLNGRKKETASAWFAQLRDRIAAFEELEDKVGGQ